MNTQVITIIGNVGSGKSTALPLISQHLDAHTIEADNLFQTTDPFAQAYLQDMSRWAFTNELWLTTKRVKLIQKEISESEKSIFVIDSGLLMSWVYTYSHFMSGRISDAEWKFYCELYDQHSTEILSNSSVVFLDYSIPTLLRRIQKRGRKYELEYYTEEYLTELQTGLKVLVEKLMADNVPVIAIEEQKIKDFEYNEEEAVEMINTVRTLAIGIV
jgi:deoxyadenosine/deoxycytidine kinase